MAESSVEVHVSTHEWGQRTSRVVRSVVVIGMCTPSVHPTFGKHLTQCRMRACATLFLRHVRPCRTCLTAAGHARMHSHSELISTLAFDLCGSHARTDCCRVGGSG
jgi:hypothetical protein